MGPFGFMHSPGVTMGQPSFLRAEGKWGHIGTGTLDLNLAVTVRAIGSTAPDGAVVRSSALFVSAQTLTTPAINAFPTQSRLSGSTIGAASELGWWSQTNRGYSRNFMIDCSGHTAPTVTTTFSAMATAGGYFKVYILPVYNLIQPMRLRSSHGANGSAGVSNTAGIKFLHPDGVRNRSRFVATSSMVWTTVGQVLVQPAEQDSQSLGGNMWMTVAYQIAGSGAFYSDIASTNANPAVCYPSPSGFVVY